MTPRRLVRPFLASAACVGALTAFLPVAPIKVACIGDSITQGAGLPPSQSYPSVLQQKLGAQYTVKNYGVSSTTLLKQGNYPYWNRSELAASKAWQPDIVVIQLGSNDAKTQNMAYAADFVADYVALIQEYSALPSHPKIFVSLPPTMYVLSQQKAGWPHEVRLAQLLPKILAAATQANATVIDVHGATASKAALFPDGLHPNAVGAVLIAQTVYRMVKADTPVLVRDRLIAK